MLKTVPYYYAQIMPLYVYINENFHKINFNTSETP